MGLDRAGHFRSYEKATADMEINPNAMLVTPRYVFAGTLGNGLYVYDRKSCAGRIHEGLPSQNVTALAQSNGYLLRWNGQRFGTNTGTETTTMRKALTAIFLLLSAPLALFADGGVLIPGDKAQPDPAILSLEEMEITVQIDNGDARVFVRQVFTNHTNRIQEGNYIFALPSSGHGFRLRRLRMDPQEFPR